MKPISPSRQISRNYVATLLCIISSVGMLAGCATPGWLPSSGPTRSEINESASSANSNVQVIDINSEIARQLLVSQKKSMFSDVFGTSERKVLTVSAGDVIEISVWEAPPASLFGTSANDIRTGPATTRATAFPEQMISSEGTINVPFAGQIKIAGMTTQQVEQTIANRLKGIANRPQVLVRIIRNNSANVTVVGEVANSTRVPLTAKGERLLDALAAAGGVRQSVNKMTLQLTRGDKVQSLPLETIIRDPQQNIPLEAGDVITSMYQPHSFTVLGATGKNDEVNFEAQGISLTQALARAGGLQDYRADARGVFIFRFESVTALEWPSKPTITPDNKVPVIYSIDLKDPTSFFVAQSFPVQNKDVLYVSNAPAAELQKFLNIVTSVAYPTLTTISATK